MRFIKPLNFDWYYKPCVDEQLMSTVDLTQYERVQLPHANIELPYNNFDERDFAFCSTYQKILTHEALPPHHRLQLCFEGVASYAKVYLNQQFIGEHKGGYTPFSFDLTDQFKFGKENRLTVIVDSSERVEIPPFGHVIDYLTYGGIYREVNLKVVHETHIKTVFIKTQEVLTSPRMEVELTVAKHEKAKQVRFELQDDQYQVMATWSQVVDDALTISSQLIPEALLWSCEMPSLYTLNICLIGEKGEQLDDVSERFGFREAIFKPDGFYLNGKRLKLRGLNRHQSYAHVGYAMPKSMQVKDAKLLKETLACNIVRTSHYPQSKHFLNCCDEIGLLVFTEIPGWQHVSELTKWRELTLCHVKEMILRDRNHPSVVLWGVRINESADDHELYTQTNALAHELDSTRQTGGVRNFSGSEWLEDVYTYNDFVHRGCNQALDLASRISKQKQAPYLVTEHNGHMFPTKRFDHEAKRLEHALRHLRVLEAMYQDEHISGAIGWCMFDYNTHKDFGSGDKICYHGVMDMYRMPKLAAAVYAMQGETPVLVVSSDMNIGEHPGGFLGPVYVFTNCDEVRLYKNDQYIGTYTPSRQVYSHVPHAPIIIDDLVGNQLETTEGYAPQQAVYAKKLLQLVAQYGLGMPLQVKLQALYFLKRAGITYEEGVRLYGAYVGDWGQAMTTYRFDGYLNGKCVKTVIKQAVTQSKLHVQADRLMLEEDETYDVVEVMIQAVDEHEQLLPYAHDVITLRVEGPLEIIGETSLALIGGARGVYLKTKQVAGHATLYIQSKHLGLSELTFAIVKK